MNDYLITQVQEPVDPTDAASKNYVDMQDNKEAHLSYVNA